MPAKSSGVKVIEEPRGLLRVCVPAEATFRSLLAMLDELTELTRGRQRLRVLIDLSAVPAPGLVEQAILGEHAARQLAHADRIASLVASGTRTGITQRVARSMGLQLQTFTSDAEAVEWLMA